MKSQLMFAGSLPRPCGGGPAGGRAGGQAAPRMNASVGAGVYPAEREGYAAEIRRILRRKEIAHRTFVWGCLGVCLFILITILCELTS